VRGLTRLQKSRNAPLMVFDAANVNVSAYKPFDVAATKRLSHVPADFFHRAAIRNPRNRT
jgi:hypothetical protein